MNHDSSQHTFEDIRLQIDKTTDVMRDNLGKVIDRQQKIDDLSDKSKKLDEHAIIFNRDAKKLCCKYCKENARSIFGIGFIVVIIIGIIILLSQYVKN